MTIICGHKWTQNQRKTLKISGKKCIFTNNRLKITGFETFISIGYLSAILIAPNGSHTYNFKPNLVIWTLCFLDTNIRTPIHTTLLNHGRKILHITN